MISKSLQNTLTENNNEVDYTREILKIIPEYALFWSGKSLYKLESPLEVREYMVIYTEILC